MIGKLTMDPGISIHALREEGDEAIRSRTLGKGISIHALREEGDAPVAAAAAAHNYFYPRPPRGGRYLNLGRTKDGEDISIHALREEGD